jgi:hypothetical protein
MARAGGQLTGLFEPMAGEALTEEEEARKAKLDASIKKMEHKRKVAKKGYLRAKENNDKVRERGRFHPHLYPSVTSSSGGGDGQVQTGGADPQTATEGEEGGPGLFQSVADEGLRKCREREFKKANDRGCAN